MEENEEKETHHHENKEHETHHENKEAEKPHHHEPEKAHHQEKEPEEKQEKEEKKHDPERVELKHIRVSTSIFVAVGMIIGFVSFIINYDIISLFLGFVVMIAIYSILRKKLNRKAKFFLGDVFAYLLVWLASWIFFFNMA